MSTRYIEILALQDPFPVVVDENARIIYVVNFHTRAVHPVDDLEGEVAKLIENAGLHTPGQPILKGPLSVVPADRQDLTITVVLTSGFAPTETHNGSKYSSPHFQVQVRATDPEAARARVNAIFVALDGQRDVTVAA